MKLSEAIISRIHAMWQHAGPLSTALLPLAWITGRVVRARKQRARKTSSPSPALPTVVVGNLMVGGTGKTPVVIAIVQYLQSHGWTPGIISRGYGVQIGSEPRTGQGMLEAEHFGDEPALIAQATGAPICVHPQRSKARDALGKDFPSVDVVVSDDGLQHLALTRDIEIVVQDERGIGNGRLLPAGPLREPADKLAEVDFIVHNGRRAQPWRGPAKGAPAASGDKPEQIDMHLHPTTVENLATGQRLTWHDWLARYATLPMAAVAAIGQPARFFNMLRAAGLQPTTTLALPDHDAYRQSPFGTLTETLVVVTAKDAVKCRRFADPRVWAIHVEAQFSDPAWLDRLAQTLIRTR